MEVRKARRVDLPEIKDLLDELDRMHREWEPLVFRPLEGGRSMEELGKMLDGEHELWVVEAGGEVVAVAYYVFRNRKEGGLIRERHDLEVDMLMVAPGFQGQGHGKRLMDHARLRAAETGCQSLLVSVRGGNQKAESWYRALGFKSFHTTLEQMIRPGREAGNTDAQT